MQKSEARGIALTVVILFLGSTCSFAEQVLAQTFDNPRHGFSISLPDGWVPMTPEKLKAANQFAQAQHPGWKNPTLHYGYQMTNAAGQAFPAVVVIRVSDTPSDRKAVFEDMRNDGSLPPGFQGGKPSFNEQLNACIVQYQAELAGTPVEASAAYFLTRKSVIKMFFYFPRFDGENLLLNQIIQNVHISEDIKAFRTPASPAGLIVGLLAVAGAAVVLYFAKPAKSP